MNRNNIIKLLLLLGIALLTSCGSMAGSGSSTGNAYVAGIVRPDSTSDDSTFIVTLVPEDYLPYDEELGDLIQKDTVGPNEEFTFRVDSNKVYNVHVEGKTTSALKRFQDTKLVRGKTIKFEYEMRPHGAIKIKTNKNFTDTLEKITIEGLAIARSISNVIDEDSYTKSFVIEGIPSGINYNGLFITENDESELFVDDTFFVNPNDTAVVTNINAKQVLDPFNSGLPSYAVYTIAVDSLEQLWFGTKMGIIGIYDKIGWKYIDINQFGVFSAVLDIVFEQDSSMWCGTNLGVMHFNGMKINYYHSENSDLPANSVHGIAINEAGDRWFATMGGGVARLSQDNEWTIYNTENSDLPSDYILRVRKDQDDNIWAICNHGVAMFDGEDWDVYDKSVSEHFTCDTISASAFDDENTWFASVDGTIVRKNDDGWEHFNSENTPEVFKKKSPIYAMYVDTQGTLWAANSHGDIYAYKNDKWICFNYYNSCVPKETGRMIAIVEDNHGSLWVSTEKAGVIEFAQKISVIGKSKI